MYEYLISLHAAFDSQPPTKQTFQQEPKDLEEGSWRSSFSEIKRVKGHRAHPLTHTRARSSSLQNVLYAYRLYEPTLKSQALLLLLLAVVVV